LNNADLRDCDLYEAEFFQAQLQGADLSGADLKGAKFHNANLNNAKLVRCDLFRADFISTKLVGTDMTLARCHTTSFCDVDLSEVVGISRVVHEGPSSIDIATLYKTKNKIPAFFLRGAGVPKEFIEGVSGIISAASQNLFFSCFISFSFLDEQFATALFERLQRARVRVWYAPEEMKAGRKMHEQIERAIGTHDKLLLILSDHSIKSDWVKLEILRARKRELTEGCRVLFPVRIIGMDKLSSWNLLDPDSGRNLAEEVRQYFIPDFSNWNDPQLFERGFMRLLRDLQANTDS
jgi:hypothetical protein